MQSSEWSVSDSSRSPIATSLSAPPAAERGAKKPKSAQACSAPVKPYSWLPARTLATLRAPDGDDEGIGGYRVQERRLCAGDWRRDRRSIDACARRGRFSDRRHLRQGRGLQGRRVGSSRVAGQNHAERNPVELGILQDPQQAPRRQDYF